MADEVIVYVVLWDYCGDTDELVAVCATREAAERFVATTDGGLDEWQKPDLKIEEWLVLR